MEPLGDDPTLEPLDIRRPDRGYRKKALPQADEVVMYDAVGRVDWEALARARTRRRARAIQALLDQFPQGDE